MNSPFRKSTEASASFIQGYSLRPSTESWAPQGGTAAQFRNLADTWRRDTAHLSSIPDILHHASYRQVVSMGSRVVPFILKDLRDEPAFWFSALREITGENPVPQSARGNMRAMADAWLQWGRAKNLI